jgi:hypothetical protein
MQCRCVGSLIRMGELYERAAIFILGKQSVSCYYTIMNRATVIEKLTEVKRGESKSSNALSQPPRSPRGWGELRQWQDLLRVVKSLNEETLCNTNQPFQDELAD